MEKHENELTGPFALNALGDSERGEVLRHAETSPAVRKELDALQETAAILGMSAEPVRPPARVKANIMSAIRNTPQLPPLTTEPVPEPEAVAAVEQENPSTVSTTDSASAETRVQKDIPAPPSDSKPSQRMFALAAGVLLIISGVLTGVIVNQNAQQQELEQQVSALSEQQAQLTRILTAPDAKSTTQEIEGGARVSLAYSADEGAMAVTTAGLPELPSDKGYEMWLISDTGEVSAGMVDGTQTDGMVMISGSMEGVTHFGITVEPAAGSAAPTTTPILVQAL